MKNPVFVSAAIALLTECAAQAVQNLTIPAPNGPADVTVNYPIVFR